MSQIGESLGLWEVLRLWGLISANQLVMKICDESFQDSEILNPKP